MSNALTLTEAAELLTPTFSEEKGPSAPIAKRSKGDALTLEDASAMLAERLSGKPSEKAKKKAETTVEQAARNLGDPASEFSAALPVLRSRREDASLNRHIAAGDFQEFLGALQRAFAGIDEATVLASEEYRSAHARGAQLEAKLHAAVSEEQSAWLAECGVEDAAFEARHPGWGDAERERIVNYLLGTGLTMQEMQYLWLVPEPIDINNPVCDVILETVAGSRAKEAVRTVLNEIGFDKDEIEAVANGTMPVHLRDHRVQELIARAVDADQAR